MSIIVVIIIILILCTVLMKSKSNKSSNQLPRQNANVSSVKNAEKVEKETTEPIVEETKNNETPVRRKGRGDIDYKSLSPHQRENEIIKDGILDNMELGVRYSIPDMLATFDCFSMDMTPNRLSALLYQLGSSGSGEIDRFEENGKAYFSIAPYGEVEQTTPHQRENELIKECIIGCMSPGVRYSIADMLISFDCFPTNMSANRLAALLSYMGPYGTGEVDRIEEKGKILFSLSEKGNQRRSLMPAKEKESASPKDVSRNSQSAEEHKNYPSNDNSQDIAKPYENAAEKNRINFFCDVDTINAFFQKGGNDDYYINNAYTVDVIDAPYLLFYKSNQNTCTLQINNRGEVYKHEESSGSIGGIAQLDKNSGLSGQASDDLRELMPAFMVSCNDLSSFMKRRGYDKQFAGLDPEDAGVMLKLENDEITASLVKGDDRPDLMCKTLAGNVISCRPYKSDVMKRVISDLIKNS